MKTKILMLFMSALIAIPLQSFAEVSSEYNVGTIQWIQEIYPTSGTGVVRVTDPDMDVNPERIDNLGVHVWSDSHTKGFALTATETGVSTGVFEGMLFLTLNYESSGPRLKVTEGDTITAEYGDSTLPVSYTDADVLSVIAKSEIRLTLESPLKQIRDGTALFDVKCSDDKIPAYKYDNMNVACVTEETHAKLVNRGWALLRFAMPEENPSQVLCNRYDGKWHPKYFGCRDVTDNQCSLMGGVSVGNLRICYDGICPEKLYSLCVTNMNLDIQYPDETQEQYDDRCRQNDTIRGPGPVECDNDLIQCVSECGNDDIWHMFDKNGIEIDHEIARAMVEQNED